MERVKVTATQTNKARYFLTVKYKHAGSSHAGITPLGTQPKHPKWSQGSWKIGFEC